MNLWANPEWDLPEPEDITRKRLLVINENITGKHTSAVHQCYDLAKKLASTEEVNELTDVLCARDIDLIGQVNAVTNRRLSKAAGITTPAKIVGNHRKHMREWMREERLDSQLTLFDEETLWSLMFDGFVRKHGWRTLYVPGKAVWKPKSKWPYLRFIKHARPSDYRANLQTQATVVNQGRDALREFELVLNIAKRLNPEGFKNDLEMFHLFLPPGRDPDNPFDE